MELWEPVVLMIRESSNGQSHKSENTNAEHWGGAARSSDEAAVMGVERRGCVRQLEQLFN